MLTMAIPSVDILIGLWFSLACNMVSMYSPDGAKLYGSRGGQFDRVAV